MFANASNIVISSGEDASSSSNDGSDFEDWLDDQGKLPTVSQ